MAKKYSITQLKAKLTTLVANSIKRRDKYRSWKSGERVTNPSALHCSHILPKGAFPKYQFCSWNLKCLTMHEHLQWWHKNPIQAALWLQTEYPEVYKKCLKMAQPEVYAAYKAPTPDELMALKCKLEET